MGTSEEQVKMMLARYDWAKKFQEKDWFDDERPQHQVTLAVYEIGRYPVTNAEYAAFVEASGYDAPRHWDGGRVPEGLTDHPVVYVTWRDALAYVMWLAERTGQPYRLPSEAEWEKAARGEDGRLWPWGDEWDAGVVNCKPGGPGATTPVDQYPDGVSPYGCHDMAGNVWEWCSTIYKGYPYQAGDGREQLDASGSRALRGGYWSSDAGRVRCAYRLRLIITPWNVNNGFRVARGSLIAP
jgi:formylglycine-generating enzyme required for sulfatase activity